MNLFTSLMRTVVPIVAGLLISLAARVGLDLDDATATAYVTAARRPRSTSWPTP